ncbi:NfeD family protein [Natronosporangium hydrolyticum]|uniref:NfeD family protein n=1 Tax=Natronosporangium hydrolyticum TaxID=2811111 RepID=A0A895YHA4_9ACTN|nr:NfeD family protein [Natronosporangium hydrolyticum]QSB13088.1 NfeD family protein [Natronosporangium hydrolyticum]
MAVLLWIVLAVVLAIAEVFTATLVLLMLAAGAGAAAIAAALGLGVVGQVVTFAAVSALSLFVLRPIIRKHAMPAIAGADETIGMKALEGAPGSVLEQVTQESGLVRIEGELWNARVYDATQILEPGERVRVIEVKGTTALVWRDEFGDVVEDDREGTL